MKLHDVLRTECIGVKIHAKNKDEVLKLIAELARKCPALNKVSTEKIIQRLKEREKIGSTGFGGGIAIPHCRLEDAEEFIIGILTCPEGVDYEALDSKKVRLFVFIIGPERESDEHIRLLSAVSQVLRAPGAIDEILSQPSADAVRESFLRYSLDEAITTERKQKDLFHILVQDDHIFEEILELFSALDCPVMVLDAQHSGAYLEHVPIYAGLWSDRKKPSNRMIVAMVDRKLTNETIRRIEQITGPLAKCTHVLVAVHHLLFAAGNLEL